MIMYKIHRCKYKFMTVNKKKGKIIFKILPSLMQKSRKDL